MALNLDNIFGIHSTALKVRAQRIQVLATNMANADTPNYQARDIDFREVLSQHRNGQGIRTYKTNARHLDTGGSFGGEQLKYRVPLQPSVDGNTVDTQFEQAAFSDNAIRYQASLMFLTGKIRGLSDAITGGLR